MPCLGHPGWDELLRQPPVLGDLPVAPDRACGAVCVAADMQVGRTLFELGGECQ